MKKSTAEKENIKKSEVVATAITVATVATTLSASTAAVAGMTTGAVMLSAAPVAVVGGVIYGLFKLFED